MNSEQDKELDVPDIRSLNELLRPFLGRKIPIFLPEEWALEKVASLFSRREITSGLILEATLRVQALSSRARILCCLPDSSGQPCGGLMDVAVDAHGAYYQCRKDPTNHRIPIV